MNALGGWHKGISVVDDDKAALIGRVEITGVGGPLQQTTVQTAPDVCGFLGGTYYDYVV